MCNYVIRLSFENFLLILFFFCFSFFLHRLTSRRDLSINNTICVRAKVFFFLNSKNRIPVRIIETDKFYSRNRRNCTFFDTKVGPRTRKFFKFNHYQRLLSRRDVISLLCLQLNFITRGPIKYENWTMFRTMWPRSLDSLRYTENRRRRGGKKEEEKRKQREKEDGKWKGGERG